MFVNRKDMQITLGWPTGCGLSSYQPERFDQESKIKGKRRYGSDLRNILRKRTQSFC